MASSLQGQGGAGGRVWLANQSSASILAPCTHVVWRSLIEKDFPVLQALQSCISLNNGEHRAIHLLFINSLEAHPTEVFQYSHGKTGHNFGFSKLSMDN